LGELQDRRSVVSARGHSNSLDGWNSAEANGEEAMELELTLNSLNQLVQYEGLDKKKVTKSAIW
jgi:hypothetical protein